MSDEVLFPNLVDAIMLRLAMAEPARTWRCEAQPSPGADDGSYEINLWCVIGRMIYGYTFMVAAAALERDHDPHWVTEVSALAVGKMRRMLAAMN